MSDDIARLIDQAIRKVEVLRRTEAKLAEAMRRQNAERPPQPGRMRRP